MSQHLYYTRVAVHETCSFNRLNTMTGCCCTSTVKSVMDSLADVELTVIFTQFSPEAVGGFLLVTAGWSSSTTTKAPMLRLICLRHWQRHRPWAAGTAWTVCFETWQPWDGWRLIGARSWAAATHLYIKPTQHTTQASTITPRMIAAVPAGEPLEAANQAECRNDKEKST